MKKILLFLLLIIVIYVVSILISVGTFRSIENQFSGETLARIPITGVEDITVDEDDNFAILIAYDRAAKRDNKPFETGVYFMDLATENFTPVLISTDFDKPFLPHGISLFQIDSAHHQLHVINHADGEYIEIFDLFDRKRLVHQKTLQDDLIYSPNDIVAINEKEFYFTNDAYSDNIIGKLAENYLGLTWCETVYFDGTNYRVVDNDISYANGINYDRKRELVYVAGVRDFAVKVFKKEPNGDLTFQDKIDCGTGVDNIELDAEGNVWVGCHPNMLAADAFMKGNQDKSPSEIIKIVYRGVEDYTVETVYMNDGTEISASTVAAPYRDLLLTGTVSDEVFLVLKRE